MIGALFDLVKGVAQEAARHVAGPCPHCERRNQEAIQAAALEAMRTRADEQEAERMQEIMLVREAEAFLLGVGERG